MINSYTLPDGSKIEYTRSGAVTGPDQQGGQYHGTSYPYYRVNGGAWRQATSRHFRARLRFEEWVSLSNDLADFLSGTEDD